MKIFKLIGIFTAAVICGLAGWSIVHYNVGIDLDTKDKITGQVVEAGIVERTSFGRYPVVQHVFSIRLKNLVKPLGTFRPDEDYYRLSENIHSGDTLTIYYTKQNSFKLNIDVYQIEKNGVILQDYPSFSRNHLIIGLIIIFGGLIFFILGIWQVKNISS